MKPTILQGHTRPIKSISFSSDSTRAFSASSDRTIISWDVEKKEKSKVYSHAAAINSFVLSSCNKYLVSGDNTGTVYIWDVVKGIINIQIEGDPSETVRSLTLSDDDKILLITFSGRGKTAISKLKCYSFESLIKSDETETEIGENNNLNGNSNSNKNDGHKIPYNNESIYYNTNSIYSQNSNSNSNNNNSKKGNKNSIKDPVLETYFHVPKKLQIENIQPIKEIKARKSKYVKALFAFDKQLQIIAAREDGVLELIDYSSGEVILEKEVHKETILDFDFCTKQKLIITSSTDGYAYVLTIDKLEVKFKFHPENPTRNLNTCKIMLIDNPFLQKKNVDLDMLFDNGIDSIEDKFINLRKADKLPIAIFSGGQDSKLVTTTHKNEGGFEIVVHDLLFGAQLLYFESHFGPVNTLGCSSSKSLFASGSEDSSVRLYNIEEYLKSIDI